MDPRWTNFIHEITAMHVGLLPRESSHVLNQIKNDTQPWMDIETQEHDVARSNKRLKTKLPNVKQLVVCSPFTPEQLRSDMP